MRSIASMLFVPFVSMAVLPVEAAAVYTYENDNKTYVATVTGANTSISDEAAAVLAANTVTNFVKRGDKTLIVDKNCSFAGDVALEGGESPRHYSYNDIYFQSGAVFGNGEGTIRAKERGVGVAGCVVDKQIAFDCGTSWGDLTGLKAYSGSSTLNRKVTFSDRNFNIYPYVGSHLIFNGGFEGSGYLHFKESGGGIVEFASEPVRMSNPVTFWEAHRTSSGGYWLEIVLSAPGNVFKAFGHNDSQKRYFTGCKLSTTVDWAFDNTDMKMYIGSGSLWDLCGTKQRVGHMNINRLDRESVQGPMTVITNSSDNSAVLYINQTADASPQAIFGGNLSVDFSGTKTITIDHEMTATGELSVSGGELVFTKEGKWHASKVSIADGASVEISSASTFPRETELSLAGTGALAIAPGDGGAVVTQTVELLTVDGVAQKRGFYPMGDGVLEVVYSVIDIADETLVLGAQEKLRVDESVKCGIFDSVTLGDGAELEIATDIFFPENADFTIVVGEGGKLNLSEGIGLYASSVTVGAAKLQPGRYTAENASWLVGDGVVYVPYGDISGTEVRWVAQGADDLTSTSGNWANENVDLGNGTAYARFVSGENAVVDGCVFLNGLSFETSSSFAVSAANAGSLVKIASGGMSASVAAPKISVPVSVEGNQTWSFPALATVSGSLKSDPLARYSLRLSGGVDFTGGGDFAGDIYSAGTLQIRGGTVFGSGSGLVTMAAKNTLVLKSVVLDKNVFFENSNSSYGNHNLSIWGDGKSVLAGLLTFGNRNLDVNVYQNSELEFKGGIEDKDYGDAGYLYFNQSTGAKITVSEKPVKVRKALYFKPFNQTDAEGFSGRLVLAVAGNTMSSFGYATSSEYFRMERTKLETTVDGALDNTSMKMFLGGNSLWDLCGTEQRIGHLDAKRKEGECSRITSSAQGAMLHLNQTANSTPEVVFDGSLSVDFSGAKTTTIAHRMTATGNVTVNGGVLQFADGGSWRNAATLTANGSAKIRLSSSRDLGGKTVMSLASESSLEIAGGAAVRVAELTVGGVKRANGRYRFGDGELVVGPQGFKLIVR